MKSRTHPPTFEIQSLEDRVLLSASSVVKPMKLAAVPTLADRAEIVKNWYGPGGWTLNHLLQTGDIAGFDSTLLTYMETRANAHYFFSPGDVPSAVSFDWTHIPQQVNSTVGLADQTMAGLFPTATNSSTYTVQLDHNFSWTTQPSTTSSGTFLHALQQMNFWPNLALAYRFTGNQAYGDELVRQMYTWTQQDPPLANPSDWPNTSPRWWQLDVAGRVDNWIFSWYLLLGTNALTPTANTIFVHDMLEHANFLYSVVPADNLTTNQTITEASALLELGTIFPEFRYSKYYRGEGESVLFKSADAQLFTDGGQDEASPGYQGVVLDALLQPYQLSQLNGVTWPQAEVDKLHNTANSYYQLLEPDGTQPALSDTYRTSGLMLVSRAAQILNEPGWALTRTRVRDPFTLGLSAATDSLSASTTPTLTNRGQDFAMPVSGYWMTRTSDSDRNARQLVMDAGPTGGFHGHFDLLSFDLYGFGKPLIADPGPYQYDSSKNRQWVLSTPAHNTISVDGQNHAAENGAGNRAIMLDQWTPTPSDVTWSAHHLAYTGLSGSPVVGRTIWTNRDDLTLVVDFANSGASHTFTSSFNLAGSNVSAVSNGTIFTTNSSGNVMVMTLMAKGISVAATKSFISINPPPNEVSPATRYTASWTGTSGVIANLVVAYAGSTPPSVTASWVLVPKRGRAGIIKITKNGVDQYVTIPPPSLSTKLASVAKAAAARAPSTELAVVAPVASKGIFSVAQKKQEVWE